MEYPTAPHGEKPTCQPYNPAVKVMSEGLSLLSSRDQGEIYFVLGLMFELKLPRTNHGTILRALADQRP